MGVGETFDSVGGRLNPGSRPGARRRGRPTKGAAAGLSTGILQIALHQFMNTGYAATSMESVATEARISKRTLYDRFPSKVLLFEAALRQQAATDLNEFRRFEDHPGPFESLLLEMGEWLLAHVLDRHQIAVYRLLVAEGHRMPELARYSDERVIGPMIAALTRVFARAAERGELIDLPPVFLAQQFLQAVCGHEVRERVLSTSWTGDEAELVSRMRDAVRLFLGGVLRRPVASVSDAASGAARPDR